MIITSFTRPLKCHLWSPQCLLYESFLPSVHFEHFALTSYILHLFFFVIMENRIFRMIVINCNSLALFIWSLLWISTENLSMMSTSKYLQRKQYFLKIFPWPWLVNPFQNGQVRGSNTAPSPSPGLVWSFNQCMQCIIPFSCLLRNQYFPW